MSIKFVPVVLSKFAILHQNVKTIIYRSGFHFQAPQGRPPIKVNLEIGEAEIERRKPEKEKEKQQPEKEIQLLES